MQASQPNSGTDRAGALAAVKLGALVRAQFPDSSGAAEPLRGGAGLVDADRAFVYLLPDARSPLGAGLAWALRHDATALHLIVDAPDGVLAAQSRGFDPVPALWLVEATSMVAMPDPGLGSPIEAHPAALAQTDVLSAAGCDVLIEHGVVIGEVAGLEVARVVVDGEGRATIRVGVGVFDQEAHEVIHGDAPVEARLGQVIGDVGAKRHHGAEPHPLNRMARAGWLRSIVVAEPGLIGLGAAVPLPPIAPRTGIYDEQPAAALGSVDGRSVLIVCSNGVDLAVVPTAAGLIGLHQPDEVVLVLPSRDHHRAIVDMAGRLCVPARLAAVPDPWPI